MQNGECGIWGIMTLEELRTTLVVDFRLGLVREMGLGRENSGWSAWRALLKKVRGKKGWRIVGFVRE